MLAKQQCHPFQLSLHYYEYVMQYLFLLISDKITIKHYPK